jgi:hypothetical protein
VYDRAFARAKNCSAMASFNHYAYSEANERVNLRFLPQEGLCWALDFNLDPMTATVAHPRQNPWKSI